MIREACTVYQAVRKDLPFRGPMGSIILCGRVSMNLGVGELRQLLIVPSRPISMTSSNSAFRTVRRRVAVAVVILALGLCLPATGHSAATSSASISQAGGQGQPATQTGQAQSGGLHDPERDRDRNKERDRALLVLSPATTVVAPGDELLVRLRVMGARELLRLPATLHYDPEVVRITSVRAGSAWEGGAAPTLMYDTSHPGELVVGLARLGREVTPITGAGEILQVTFEAIAPGDTELTLKRFALLGHGGESQRAEVRPAKVSVQ